MMVDYQRMGNGGTRPATVTLNTHALVYFKEFLHPKEMVFHVDKRTTIYTSQFLICPLRI